MDNYDVLRVIRFSKIGETIVLKAKDNFHDFLVTLWCLIRWGKRYPP